MQVFSGIATLIRQSAQVSGNYYGVGTAQILSFRIGSQSIQLCMPTIPQVEEGDTVSVAGYLKNGVLIARAYRNLSNNTYGKWHHGWLSCWIWTAIIFGPIGFFLFLAALRGADPSPLMVIGLYAFPFIYLPVSAVSSLAGALQTGRANQLVWSV